MKPEHLNVTIVGAGIVGVATALYLQRDGHSVTILDQNGPGEGCSRGNAGILALDSVSPLARLALIRELPAMLGDPLAPMRLAPRALFQRLPWVVRFVLAARPRRVAASASALAALLHTALDAYRPLLDASGAQDLVREDGWLAVYESERAFARAGPERMRQRRFGVQMDTLSGDEARRLVPALGPHIRHAVHFPKVAHTVDPFGLVQRLAEHFVARGGRIEHARVVGVEASAAGRLRLRTETGVREVPCLVIAAGASSAELARRLGHRVPLVPERGYHAMLPQPGVELPMPVLAAEHAYVATPMNGGLRLAGTSEIAAPAAPPDYQRARVLMERGRQLLPGLNTEGYEEWMGERPTLPDSLPVIGRSPRVPNVYFAFGHQHLGLTLAAVTGRLVADMAAGRPTDVDMRPYRIERF